MTKSLWYRCFVAGLASALILPLAAPLAGQTAAPGDLDFGTTGEPPPDDEGEDKPFDPSQPSSSWNDPGTDGVGALTDHELFALFGASPTPPLDSEFLDEIVLPEGAVPLEPADTPFPVGARCSGNVGPVVPLKVSAQNPRYFAFGGTLRVLVGVSADAGCALKATTGNANICNAGNYTVHFDEAAGFGLNKVQLWVALLADLAPENQPFKYDAAGGFWQLDQPNVAYFSKLWNVVAAAKARNLFVEVVFLVAGGEIDDGQVRFKQGPWGGAGRVAGVPVKFDLREDFLRASTTFKPELFAAQKAVIQWTVDELWCFDNLFFQIANEPEALGAGSEANVPWHRAMVAQVLAAEQPYKANNRLSGGHLIGVQPFLAQSADNLRQDTNIAILNGHYTTVFRPVPEINLGAIPLVRTNPGTARIFGFNEGKITPLNSRAGTEIHQNGTRFWGQPDSTRAEAWEFFFHQGANFDHFGYRPLTSTGAVDARAIAIRTQLGKLRTFLHTLPLARLKASADPPSWVGLPPYPRDRANSVAENWEPATLSRKYWAALETTAAATGTTGRVYLAYFHHSVPRCDSSSEDYTAPFPGGCGGSPRKLELVYQGYDARIKGNAYQERLTLKLGAQPGVFRVEWLDPVTTLPRLPAKTINFTPSAAGGTCTGSEEAARCVLLSPTYHYDLALKITQQ